MAEDTLKCKPRRPAPTVPPPRGGKGRPIPEPEPITQALEQGRPVLGPELSKQAPSQPVRVAPVVGAEKTYSLKRPAPKKPERTAETWRQYSSEDLLAASMGIDGQGGTVPSRAGPGLVEDNPSASNEPLGQWNAALDVSAYPDEDDFDETMFEGGLETMPDAGGDDDQDFILEPPEDFSQTSVGDLDDIGAPPEASEQGSGGSGESERVSLVGVQFRTRSSHRDGHNLENQGNGFRDSSSFPDEQSGVKRVADKSSRLPHQSVTSHDPSNEHKRRVKKSKKKHESKDYSETGPKKHKSKKKKRQSASTDELLQRGDSEGVQLPEYEFDRGLDRVPIRSTNSGHSRQQQAAWTGTGSHYSQEVPEEPRATVSKGSRVSSSYDNVAAGDDFSPPWLQDEIPVQSQELSFEELDAYADDDGQDEPRVVYKEDVAALVW